MADRQIYIPTARKLPMGTLKVEYRIEPRDRGEAEYYLGAGVTRNWEIEVRSQSMGSSTQYGTFDLTYNLVSPLTNLSPGIAFGVQDLMNKTPEGVRPFAVFTFREGFFVIGGEVAADLTIGMSIARKRLYPIVGASIPFSDAFRLLAEHDGFRISAGIELRPARPVALKFLVRGNSALLGISAQHRF